MDWARKRGTGLEFTSIVFAHPKAGDGCTLPYPNDDTEPVLFHANA